MQTMSQKDIWDKSKVQRVVLCVHFFFTFVFLAKMYYRILSCFIWEMVQCSLLFVHGTRLMEIYFFLKSSLRASIRLGKNRLNSKRYVKVLSRATSSGRRTDTFHPFGFSEHLRLCRIKSLE